MRGESSKKKRNKGDNVYSDEKYGVGSPVISNTKARGVILLIAALLIFQTGTFIFKIVNKSEKNDKTYDEEFYQKKDSVPQANVKAYKTNKLFRFNPNNINLDSLVLLGFSPKQAQSILNYRNKGGRFFKKTDFAKMYVVSNQKYAALEDWIHIPVSDSAIIVRKKNTKDTLGLGRINGVNKKVLPDSILVKQQWHCNLNLADSTQLIKLYGIGPYFAKKILNYRQRLGGSFTNPEQLLEIDGIDKERYAKFEQKLFIDTAQINKYSIEELERKFMEQHPYIGAYAARGIILYRENKKTISKDKITLSDLVNENILSSNAAFKLRFYIK